MIFKELSLFSSWGRTYLVYEHRSGRQTRRPGGISWPFVVTKMHKNTLYPEHVLFLASRGIDGASPPLLMNIEKLHTWHQHARTCARAHTHTRSLITNIVCRLINYHYHQFCRVSNNVISEIEEKKTLAVR
jgi:hypothetical protein